MFVVFLILLAPLRAVGSVVIDGSFTDWPRMTSSAPQWELSGIADDKFIYLHIAKGGPPRVIQQLDSPLTIALDLDEDHTTGSRHPATQGAEITFSLSPAQGPRTGGVASTSFAASGVATNRSPYDFGWVMAPTTASQRHEIRLQRALLPASGNEIGVALIENDKRTTSTSVPVPRLTDTSPAASLPPKKPGSLRVVCWNIERGGLLKRASRVGAITSLLDPDVMLIQELEDSQDPAQVKSMLETVHSNQTWTVVMSPRGSGLRVAVASRLDTKSLPELGEIRRSNRTDNAIRIAGALITTPGGAVILTASIHLKCCGGLHGPEDLTRISEMLSIRESLATAIAKYQPDGLVVGGDLNLVASPIPLDILTADGQSLFGFDHSGDLEVAPAFHPDGRDVYTWYDEHSRFTPGRLDFIVTGGRVIQANAFVLDTSDLSASSRKTLPASATADASDHLPVVLDLVPE